MKVFVLMAICALQAPDQPIQINVETEVVLSAQVCVKAAERLDREFQPQCTSFKTSCTEKTVNQTEYEN